MRTLRVLVIAAGLTLAIGACRSSTEPGVRALRITTDDIGLTLQNPNPWPVFYMAVNENSLALLDYALCEDPTSGCPRVLPGETVSLPYSKVSAYDGSTTQILVIQWLLKRKAGGGYSATDVFSTHVTVPRTT
jgi:hypothetical protein